MKKKILIVGGYGAVGRQIATNLVHTYPNLILVAGRNYSKAEKLADELSSKVIPYAFDLANFEDDPILNEVQLVIVCLDSPNTKFVEACIIKGINYLDISAQYASLQLIENLDAQARTHKSTIVLSAGLAPGMTNLLAQHAYSQLQAPVMVEISILLGLGEKHGEQAYRWTFNHMDHTYILGSMRMDSFSDPIRTELLGTRKFYTFDFSDQHVLRKTLPHTTVQTRMAFDSNWFTSITAFLRKCRLTKLFKNKRIQDFAITLFDKWSFGSAVFGVKVEAKDKIGDLKTYTFTGYNEGKITAAFTTELARHLLTLPQQAHGVFHSHQIISNIPDFIERVQHYDPSFEMKEV
ncbi:hypothetical protein E2P86_11465 [Sphingobacterium psychroaquaticum]|uniref:saccharopine dehydrogenase family protein n=1 Tax=Sphingobacterium psychroaquaticum TaxID=561061 RepID=UPI001068EAFC|nr:saccharopine dehydrogenase NADP-binding domain-containing protein [Sphingobacterium psychroaquaticum]QBQ41735.1 hypothetical protein E2P86_11465 [Sphingobacterium psychroaquaticum]